MEEGFEDTVFGFVVPQPAVPLAEGAFVFDFIAAAVAVSPPLPIPLPPDFVVVVSFAPPLSVFVFFGIVFEIAPVNDIPTFVAFSEEVDESSTAVTVEVMAPLLLLAVTPSSVLPDDVTSLSSLLSSLSLLVVAVVVDATVTVVVTLFEGAEGEDGLSEESVVSVADFPKSSLLSSTLFVFVLGVEESSVFSIMGYFPR